MSDDDSQNRDDEASEAEPETQANGGVSDLEDVLTAERGRESPGAGELEFPDKSGDAGQESGDLEPLVDDENPARDLAIGVVGLLGAAASAALVYINPLGLLSLTQGYILAAGAGGLAVLGTTSIQRAREEPVRLPDPTEVERPDIVEPPSAGEKRSRFGLIGKLLREYNVRRKRKKLGSQGYIEWYLIEDGWPRPKLIKPKRDATNLPYHKYKGERYFFPESARVADERGGLWVVIHQRGDADPINLKEPKDHSLPAAAVEKWAQLVVQTKEGLFGGLLDLTPQEIFRYGIYAFIGYMILRTALQNGVIPGM